MKGRKAPAILLLLLLCTGAAWCAGACETVLTQADISANRARAVEFFGPSSSAQLGRVLNAAGDLNDDGFDDFALAAPMAASGPGAVFVVFGRNATAWETAQFDFGEASPDPSSWIKIGGESGIQLGRNGVAHGDFNGDGADDLLVGTSSAKAFCVYGQRGTWSSFETNEIETGVVAGFAITGGIGSSKHVGNAGDMNGDGIEDLLVTDTGNSPSTGFVIFGVEGASRSTFNVSSIDGSNGFAFFDGTTFLGAFGEMDSAGDVDGDGLRDLAIGSYRTGNFAGSAYILRARNVSVAGQQWQATLNLTSDINGNNGVVVEGVGGNSQIGWAVVGAGDVNADGFADVFIGSVSTGAWLLFGHPAPWTTPLSTSQLEFHFASELVQNWGYSGGAAGDFNGDGFGDFLVGGNGAPNSTGTTTGMAALIFGHSGSWPTELGRSDAVGSIGFLVDGPSEGSFFGQSTRGAGDVNGDGLADFIIGAYQHDTQLFTQAGYALLVFGTPDDHCAVCSNTSSECLTCEIGFVLNGTICEFEMPGSSSHPSVSSVASTGSTSSSSHASTFSSTPPGSALSSTTPSASSSGISSTKSDTGIVVIETGGGGGTVGEVAAEVAQLLGVDVGQISVVEITPGTFEVTVINEEVAQQLVTLIEQCMEEEEAQ